MASHLLNTFYTFLYHSLQNNNVKLSNLWCGGTRQEKSYEINFWRNYRHVFLKKLLLSH